MSHTINPTARIAMRRAWALARQGQAIYGGPVRQYLREALRICWSELKADPTQQAVMALMADLRAARSRPAPQAPTPYLSRFASRRSGGYGGYLNAWGA